MSDKKKPKKYDRSSPYNNCRLDSEQICKVRKQMGLPCRNCCYYGTPYCANLDVKEVKW